MISCPKCGFEQPPDDFCANCGVNIRRYAPPMGPLWQRVYRNPHLLIPLVITMVLGTSIFVYQGKQVVLQRRLLDSQILDKTRNSDGDNQAADGEANKNQFAARPEDEENLPTAHPTLTATPGNVTTLTGPQGFMPEKGEASTLRFRADEPLEISLRSYEVSHTFLTQILKDAQLLNESQDYALAILPNAAKAISEGQKGNEWILLERGEALMAENGPPYLLTPSGSGAGGQRTVGLTALATLSELSETSASLQLELQRRLKEVESEPIRQLLIYEQVTLSPGSAALFLGLLPRRKPSETELRLAPGTSLEVLRSPSYLNQESDLLIIIEPKLTTPSPK